jgi:hypothetical protein
MKKYTKYTTMESLLSTQANWLTAIAFGALVLVAVLGTTGALLLHNGHDRLSADMFVAATVMLGVVFFFAIEAVAISVIPVANFFAFWVRRIAQFVVIVAYVTYVWLLMTIFGDKALHRRHA